MRENKYNDRVFFEKYSQMERSKKGLAGAGEWHELQKLLPDFQGRRVLDLGCGYGWHCKYAADHGAACVLGTDISKKMLETARERNAGPSIEYRCAAMEDLRFSDGSFDVVLSSLAFHYVKDFEPLVRNISRWLKPGGSFVFSVEHPVFTAYGSQDWYYDENGDILHFPVDNYYIEGRREAVFLGERVAKYHRTLTSYLDTLLKNGFKLLHVVEPQPPEGMMGLPGMKDELRRPMMLLVSAEKDGGGMGETVMETDRLILRKMTQADYRDLCAILQDEQVMYAYEGAFSDEEVQNWLDKQLSRYQEDGIGLYAVLLKGNGAMIGQCGLTLQDTPGGKVLEIGYLFQKAYWHHGYAIEAAKACKEYAFQTLGAEEVFSIIRETNTASQNVARRNGMTVAGTFVKHYRGVDMPHDIFSVKRGQ